MIISVMFSLLLLHAALALYYLLDVHLDSVKMRDCSPSMYIFTAWCRPRISWASHYMDFHLVKTRFFQLNKPTIQAPYGNSVESVKMGFPKVPMDPPSLSLPNQ